jgi:hypothetical protein
MRENVREMEARTRMMCDQVFEGVRIRSQTKWMVMKGTKLMVAVDICLFPAFLA